MIRQIKRVEQVEIGDWLDGCEVKATTLWGDPPVFVDLHLDDGRVKLCEAGRIVTVTVTPETASQLTES